MGGRAAYQPELKVFSYAHTQKWHFARCREVGKTYLSAEALHLRQLCLQSGKQQQQGCIGEGRKFYHVRIMRSVISALTGSQTHTVCYL